MRGAKVIGFIAAVGSAAHAQALNLRGKITNASGQPVDKAVVELMHQGAKDTTGPDGAYALTGTVTALRKALPAPGMSLDRGVLQLSLAHAAPIKVEVFDLQGNQIRMEALPNASAGTYRWDFAAHSPSDRMMIIKASIGREARSFRFMPVGESGDAGDHPAAAFTTAAGYLAKAAADLDTLKVTASGYAAKKTAVSAWDATMNITLDAQGSAKSAGCGKTPTLKTGKALSFTPSGGQARTYNLLIPADYDNNTAYRLVVSIHWLNGTANDVTDGKNWATTKPYFGLQELANPAGGKSSTIFVAPQGLSNSWPSGNVPFITALVHHLESDLCIDTTRVFAEGFSMGGSMSYALACEAPEMFRAVAVHSGGPMSGCNKKNKPVAYFMTHGTKDSTCTYPGFGVPQINEFAKLNGCQAMDIPNTLKPTNQSGMDPACADFKGCSDGYPARACIFVGPHNPTPGGANSWVPGETWKFFTQF